MAKINITGFTSAQRNRKTANKKGIISFSNLLKEMLEDSGHVAEYEMENADLNIVFVLDPSSINAGFAVESLDLLTKENCIIAFDDWNIRGFYKTIDKIIETEKFSKTHHSVDYKGILRNLKTLNRLAKGEYKSIFPAYKTGKHELLEIRGESTCIDPSIYIKKEIKEQNEMFTPNYEIMAVHASLANKWQELSRKKYSFINLKNETEDTVFEYYKRHRIVMNPLHYHNESGWFRNRYALANMAKAVIIEDYNSVFGNTYSLNRKDVNEKNINQLYELQNKAYKETIMSKDEIAKILKKVI